MKEFAKISKYNLILFLLYAVLMFVTPKSVSEDSLFIFFAVAMVIHVVVLFLLSLVNLIQTGSNGPGLSYLINSFLVALIGFSSCLAAFSI